jgi:ADP-ribosyl-[dinitrogen reductase] hydrolase
LTLTIASFPTEENDLLAGALDQVRTKAPGELLDALDVLVEGPTVRPLSASGSVVDTLQTALQDALLETGRLNDVEPEFISV